MHTNPPTFDLTNLARRAVFSDHWRWTDGMRWYLPDPDGGSAPVSRGIVGADAPPPGAVCDLRDPDTVNLVAARVRYLFDNPELVAVYEESTCLYRIHLPDGRSTARYSPAGAWVGLLELFSYQVAMKFLGRSR